MSADALHPCPLCGGKRGYALRDDGDHKRWNMVCLVCCEIVAECRRHGGDKAARQAWNEAGAYAAGLLAERDRLAAENAELKAANAELERLCDETYVARGADAYNHACDLSEEFDAKREARGLAPIFGTPCGRSLCDGMSNLFKQFERIEAENAELRKRVAELESAVRHVDDCVSVSPKGAWRLSRRFDYGKVSDSLLAARPNPENTDGR